MSDNKEINKEAHETSPQDLTSADLAAEAVKPKKSFWPIIIVLLLIAAGSYGAWWYFHPNKVAVVTKVKKGTATYAVYGTVNVEPVLQTIVRAQSSGVVAKLNCKKGDVVKQGDILAEIADDTANQLLMTAQRAYENAISLRGIGPASKPARDAKERKVEQLKKLLAEGNIPETEYNNNQAELKTLQDKVKTEDLALEDAVKEAREKLDAAMASVKQTRLLSPQNGVILDVYHQLGEVIAPKEQVFLVGSEDCQIRAQINEEDVGVIRTGLEAVVRLYSHKGKDFSALVKEVLPQGKNQEYSVILNLKNPPDPFLPDMTGELNIIIGSHKDALIIPTRAVRGTSDLKLLIVEENEVKSVPVKIGYKSLEMTEVLQGVKEGDLVILNDQDLFKPGDRVKVQVSE